MKHTSNPIVFFGTDEFSLTALTGLLDAGYPVAAVVTKPDSKQGRGHKLTPPLVKVLATSHNIPVWQPTKMRDIAQSIRELGQPVGVLSSYGKIIPESIIDLFTPGIINIHPSLLPLYRGPSPIETALLNGDKKTGVSIMQLTAAMDAGPVYTAVEHPLSGTETKPELYQTLAQRGAELLIESLPRIVDGTLLPSPQDDAKVTYTAMLSTTDSLLNPEKVTAAEAERRVRAYLGFPKTKLQLNGHLAIITKAHVASSTASQLDIMCKDNTILAIDELIAPSGRRMSASDFERGYLQA